MTEKADLKKQMKELKGQRDTALEQKEHKELKRIRRSIRSVKRQLRALAQRANVSSNSM